MSPTPESDATNILRDQIGHWPTHSEVQEWMHGTPSERADMIRTSFGIPLPARKRVFISVSMNDVPLDIAKKLADFGMSLGENVSVVISEPIKDSEEI